MIITNLGRSITKLTTMRNQILVLALTVLLGCSQKKENESTEKDPFEGLEQGWNQIKPGGETVCSEGSEYVFYFRPGDAGKLVVFFQGGGACWNAGNCDLTKEPTFDSTVGEEDDPRLKQADNLYREWDGIFDQSNPENPVADYSFLFIPYCTGDVHLGNRTVQYSDSVTVRHQGFANAESALHWVFDRITSPEKVFVTGESAGSLASTVYAMALARHYPGAYIAQLGDASAGYKSDSVPNTLAKWGTHEVVSKIAGTEVDSSTMNFEKFAVMAASKNPGNYNAVYNSDSDEVQGFFLQQLGEGDFEVKEKLRSNLDEIDAQTDNFFYYTDSGTHHTIISRQLFYQSEVDGVKLSQWVKGLLEKEAIESLWFE